MPPVPAQWVDLIQANFPQSVRSPFCSPEEQAKRNRYNAWRVADEIWRHGFLAGMVEQDKMASQVRYMVVTQEQYDRFSSEAASDGHRYLSTGCLHGEHAYCQSMTGQAGAKRPGQCKFCEAGCICTCHNEDKE